MKPIADAVAVAALLNGLLPALAVAAAAWVLLKVTPRMNAATRHAIWWLVLALAVLLPVGFAIHDAGRVRVPARRERVVRMPDRNGPAELIGPPATVSAPVHRAAQLELREGRWSLWLPILWLGLFAAQLGRLGLSYLRLRESSGGRARHRPNCRRVFARGPRLVRSAARYGCWCRTKWRHPWPPVSAIRRYWFPGAC